ncbi:MAG: hypothetical protein KME50_38900 [Nostoc desertorum CM1-VF14]|nr:hypothetical protein [Nostoc desertorum CM1-VF14]
MSLLGLSDGNENTAGITELFGVHLFSLIRKGRNWSLSKHTNVNQI